MLTFRNLFPPSREGMGGAGGDELPLGTCSALCLGPCMDCLALEMSAWGVDEVGKPRCLGGEGWRALFGVVMGSSALPQDAPGVN